MTNTPELAASRATLAAARNTLRADFWTLMKAHIFGQKVTLVDGFGAAVEARQYQGKDYFMRSLPD